MRVGTNPWDFTTSVDPYADDRYGPRHGDATPYDARGYGDA